VPWPDAPARPRRPAYRRVRSRTRNSTDRHPAPARPASGARARARRLLRKTATKLATGKLTAPVEIDEPTLRDALGKQRFYQESAERTAVAGVATGLAVTGTGGDVLFVEATRMQGGEGLVLTGQLGDVMKESARIALSYIHSQPTTGSTRAPSRARASTSTFRRGDPEGRPERRHHHDNRTSLR
jgi:hypothetical protein